MITFLMELDPGQKRRYSLMEALVSIFLGYVLYYLATLLIFPSLGWKVSPGQNLLITNILAGLSFLRIYGVRRFFNWLQSKGVFE